MLRVIKIFLWQLNSFAWRSFSHSFLGLEKRGNWNSSVWPLTQVITKVAITHQKNDSLVFFFLCMSASTTVWWKLIFLVAMNKYETINKNWHNFRLYLVHQIKHPILKLQVLIYFKYICCLIRCAWYGFFDWESKWTNANISVYLKTNL